MKKKELTLKIHCKDDMLHNKKDLRQILSWAKSEVKEWQNFIKLVENKIKNKVNGKR